MQTWGARVVFAEWAGEVSWRENDWLQVQLPSTKGRNEMIPKGLLPEDLQNDAFIAGGYAACPPLASDMDVWVRVRGTESLAEARQRILDWLDSEMWPFEVLEDGRALIGETRDAEYHLVGIEVLKVAVVRSTSGYLTHPIHIMVVSGDVQDVLNSFDISTHQVALAFGNVVMGKGWTPITEPPRILKMTPTTPARLEKIAARYGHALTPQEIR